MDQRQEAKELITKWVFEGKDIEKVTAKLDASRYAGVLSAHDIVNEFYAAGTAKKLSRPGPGRTLSRIVGILTLLISLGLMVGPACCGYPIFISGRVILGLILGITLTFWPHKANEDFF